MNKKVLFFLFSFLFLITGCTGNIPATVAQSPQIPVYTSSPSSEPAITITPSLTWTLTPTNTITPTTTSIPDLPYWEGEGIWIIFNSLIDQYGQRTMRSYKYLVINPEDLSYHLVTYTPKCSQPLQYSSKIICPKQGQQAYLKDLKTGKQEEIVLPFDSSSLWTWKGIYASVSNTILLVEAQPQLYYPFDIYKYEISNGKTEKIAGNIYFEPEISVNGNYIIGAYDTKEWSFYYLINRERWELIKLPDGHKALGAIIWSPIESKVILGAGVEIEGTTSFDHLYIYDVATNRLTLFANIPGGWGWSPLGGNMDEWILDIEWSPDGKRIAYKYDRDVCIFELESETTKCYPLSDAWRHMAWSPAGNELAIEKNNEIIFLSFDGNTRSIDIKEFLGNNYSNNELLFWR